MHDGSPSAATTLPALRQLVFLSGDLESTVAIARRDLGLRPGVSDAAGMAALGFVHEVLAIDQTFLEFTAPLTPEAMPARLVARRGDLGYMVVVQVPDIAAVRERAARLGVTPVHDVDYEGNRVTQWHPRDFGTLLEVDQVDPPTSWHMAPAVFEIGCTDAVQDVAAIDVAVREPAQVAAAWAQLIGVPLEPGATVLELGGRLVRFVAAEDGEGLVAVELPATDRATAGRELVLSGVLFRLT